MPEITSGMMVADLIAAYPFAVSVLSERNLHCIICGEPVWGTIEELARDKHLNPQQIQELIKDLNIKAKSLEL
jgi:hypothetical protein